MVNRKWTYGKWAILLLAIIAICGCRPRGVLSSKKMQNVLYDLHRADAILQKADMDYGHDEAVAKYYEVVLEKHHITQAQFDSSLVWYTDHPSRFDKIYPKLRARCEKEKELYDLALNETKQKETIVKPELPPVEQVLRHTQHGLPTDLWKQDTLSVTIPFSIQK